MRRYLLDSGVASDYVNDRRDVPARCRSLVRLGHRIGLRAPVYAELLGGIELSESREANLKKVHRVRSHFVMWTFDEAAAEEYARLFGVLTRTGRPMQQIDIQIAAIAVAQGNTTIVTYDSDLCAIPGLSVENWLETP